MLAKNVNNKACFLSERGDCEFFASKLAPTKNLTVWYYANNRWICSCSVSRSNGLARIGALRVMGLWQSRISCG